MSFSQALWLSKLEIGGRKQKQYSPRPYKKYQSYGDETKHIKMWRHAGSHAYLSQERAINLTSLRLNSSSNSRTLASSVVHTGVKSPGCVKRIPQEFSSHLWNEIGPTVVSARKSGNTAPRMGMIEALNVVSFLTFEFNSRGTGTETTAQAAFLKSK